MMGGVTYAEFMSALMEAYFRPERPSFAVAYRQTLRLAEERGWPVPLLSAARRRISACRRPA